jgi:hypothetical protein
MQSRSNPMPVSTCRAGREPGFHHFSVKLYKNKVPYFNYKWVAGVHQRCAAGHLFFPPRSVYQYVSRSMDRRDRYHPFPRNYPFSILAEYGLREEIFPSTPGLNVGFQFFFGLPSKYVTYKCSGEICNSFTRNSYDHLMASSLK